MATKKKSSTDENPIVDAAKKIGAAAGKVASMVGIESSGAPKAAAPKKGKLQKKNKSRVPRRMKKEQKKAAAGLTGRGKAR